MSRILTLDILIILNWDFFRIHDGLGQGQVEALHGQGLVRTQHIHRGKIQNSLKSCTIKIWHFQVKSILQKVRNMKLAIHSLDNLYKAAEKVLTCSKFMKKPR